MKVLVFDIWGDYGHYRKFYTTSSPLTYSFPPPPTIAGILGAIYGADKKQNEYLTIFGQDNCSLALQIINPIKKVRIGLNLLETKGTNLKLPMSDKNLAPRTQIRTEFVKEPKNRIYVAHKDHIVFNRLVEKIKKHESFYTISFGLSELIANFKFVGVYEGEEKSENNFVEIQTPIMCSNLIENGIEIEPGKRYFKEKLPIKMNLNRVVEKYDDVIFEPDGKTIKAIVKQYCKLENGENVAFF